MKNKIRSVLIGAALIGCALFNQKAKAQWFDFVQQPYIDGTTNNISVYGSNYQRSLVLIASTNTYNLGFPTGSQLNTNQWPSLPLCNSYGLHERYLNLSGTIQGNVATNGVEFLVLATSNLGQTNSIFGTNQIIVPIPYFGSTNVSWNTNVDTGGSPFVFLLAIYNTNTIVLTNNFGMPVGKLYN